MDLESVVCGYLEAAEWPEDQEPSADFIAEATKDCADFIAQCGEIELSDSSIGHDFWLTRNGHGAGFWDRKIERGEELTELCKEFGEHYMY